MRPSRSADDRNKSEVEVRRHADHVIACINAVAQSTTLKELLATGDKFLKDSSLCGPMLFASVWSLEHNDKLSNQILDVCVHVLSWVQPTREQGLTEDAEVVARIAQTLKYYSDACGTRADWEEQNRMAIHTCREDGE